MKWSFFQSKKNTNNNNPQNGRMDDVMRRVDAQVGRAVTRLADR